MRTGTPQPRRTTGRRAGTARVPLLCALAAVALGIAPARAAPEESSRVVVVRSSNDDVYRTAERVLRERMARSDRDVRCVLLADLAHREGLPTADLFVAIGTSAAAWLHPRVRAPGRMTYCLVADPRTAGIRPGPERVGVSMEVPAEDQFELIAAALPEARRPGMLYRSSSPRSRRMLSEARDALPEGWRLRAVDIDACDSIASAVKELLEREPEVVWTYLDGRVHDRATLGELLRQGTLRRRIPVFGYSARVVQAGALVGIDIRPEDQGAQAAALADRLLRRPRRGSVESPRPRFRIAVNLKAARALDVTVPDELLRRAGILFGER